MKNRFFNLIYIESNLWCSVDVEVTSETFPRCVYIANLYHRCIVQIYFLLRRLKMRRNFVFGCVLVFYCYDYLLNVEELCIGVCCCCFCLPQIIIGPGCVIYHLEALLVLIRTTFKTHQNFVPVLRRTA